jgi:hypothetical protein
VILVRRYAETAGVASAAIKQRVRQIEAAREVAAPAEKAPEPPVGARPVG